jgi:hypothetical protein
MTQLERPESWVTRPRPPSSHGYPHTDAPECPECETDVFVGAAEGRAAGYVCWCCGWRSNLKLQRADTDIAAAQSGGIGDAATSPKEH